MNQEFEFKGTTFSGIPMLVIELLLLLLGAGSIVFCIIQDDALSWLLGASLFCGGLLLILVAVVLLFGFMIIEPGEARVCLFFGDYCGTFTRSGYYWVNPLVRAKDVSLRARNLEVPPIKVNDKQGNPVMIGLVLVWRMRDTYKAMFEVDAQTMAATNVKADDATADVGHVMQALENFVRVQSDAALRQVASHYAYDNDDQDPQALTLRSSAEEINEQLESKLNERLAMAGIEVVEARLNYLAYAPEIAAVMLRRQQASAIISAREKIVEGAVSMTKMALERISDEGIVALDEDRKAAMVSNLLVVLCGEENAQPVVNTGTLHH